MKISKKEKHWQRVEYIICSQFELFVYESFVPVISLLGVVLIARPPFIFGSDGHSEEHDVTIGHRMIAVWYVFVLLLSVFSLSLPLVFP